MKVPSELRRLIAYPARKGEEIICSSRAVMYYLGDFLSSAEGSRIITFQSIDSQTDHIQLDSNNEFSLPSVRVSLAKNQDGKLLGSSVQSIMRPGDAGYEEELRSVFEDFDVVYHASAAELLNLQ
jgi:hypothetical protein